MSYHSSTTMNKNTDTANNSKWQQLVVGAGSAAGSTAAVVSEESMKCLKYCLSWLQYAMGNIAQQMAIIRAYLVSLATTQKALLPQQHQQSLGHHHKRHQHEEDEPMVLTTIKSDMVNTIKKVINIISCYASTALPYQAKATIRGAILSLPSRWALLCDETPLSSIGIPESEDKGQDVALRLLAFGQESTEMLGSIHSVFDETIQRAENWLERLRMINPISSNPSTPTSSLPTILPLPTNHDPMKNTLTNDDDFCNVLLPPIRNLYISPSSPSER
ncbi:transcription factor Opi1-domain-containing protein [Pilobolus umbonatus]|nr:transcription factor Opi1-domain-containing protein [Pilobolus umbonatus]